MTGQVEGAGNGQTPQTDTQDDSYDEALVQQFQSALTSAATSAFSQTKAVMSEMLNESKEE